MTMPEEEKGAAAQIEETPQASPPAAEEGSTAAEMADIESLQRDLEKQRDLAKHHLDQWKRSAADLENYRKRVDRERAELLKLGNSALIASLLPVLDDLERAFATLPESLTQLTWTEGLLLIDRKLRLVLERHGLEEIEAVGKAFDPQLHQAVSRTTTDAFPSGQVVAELQKGYRLHDRILRPAMVTVAESPTDSGAGQAQEGPTAVRGEASESEG